MREWENKVFIFVEYKYWNSPVGPNSLDVAWSIIVLKQYEQLKYFVWEKQPHHLETITAIKERTIHKVYNLSWSLDYSLAFIVLRNKAVTVRRLRIPPLAGDSGRGGVHCPSVTLPELLETFGGHLHVMITIMDWNMLKKSPFSELSCFCHFEVTNKLTNVMSKYYCLWQLALNIFPSK